MSCVQALSGIPAMCDTNMGGIVEVYIANFSDVTALEVDTTTHLIDTITMAAGEGSTTKKFKAYYFKKNTGSLTSTYTIDPANAVNFVQSDLSLVFGRQDTAKRIEIAALALGELRVIVKDVNGKYWFLGFNEFVASTAAGAETGVNRTDGNKYTITLTDYSASLPYEVDGTLITSTLIDF